MTKEELISIACRFMDFNNTDEHYITTTSGGRTFINGGYQTDLRAFLTEVKELEYFKALDIIHDRYDKRGNKS